MGKVFQEMRKQTPKRLAGFGIFLSAIWTKAELHMGSTIQTNGLFAQVGMTHVEKILDVEGFSKIQIHQQQT